MKDVYYPQTLNTANNLDYERYIPNPDSKGLTLYQVMSEPNVRHEMRE